jgi:hypothetical protein
MRTPVTAFNAGTSEGWPVRSKACSFTTATAAGTSRQRLWRSKAVTTTVSGYCLAAIVSVPLRWLSAGNAVTDSKNKGTKRIVISYKWLIHYKIKGLTAISAINPFNISW